MNLKVIGLFGIILLCVVGTIFFMNDKQESPPNAPPPATTPANNPPKNDDELKNFLRVEEITQAMSGMTKETCGIVTILNESKGNVFFTLKSPDSDKIIKCVLFAKTNNDDPERKQMLLESRDNNSLIYLKGEVDIYKGELELKVWQVYKK